MRKPIEQLYVEILDWPDTFFVEADGPDTDYPRVFGVPDPDEQTPYLVDLSEFDHGWCGCTGFRIHILPRVERGAVGGYVECKHILAARDFRRRMGEKPTQTPDALSFGPTMGDQQTNEGAVEETGGIVDDTKDESASSSNNI